MAKFRDSTSDPVSIVDGPPAVAAVEERSIGTILTELRRLSAEQVERVLSHQQKHGLRFGEAAVALGLATRDDVLQALSQQFDYAYLPELSRQLSPELVALSEPFGPQAESFRALRTQLSTRFFVPGHQTRRALAVISPESGDGRSYAAANLAVSFAQLGGRTLLVDADLRRPRVHELFKADAGPGLSGLLAGRADERVIRQVSAVPSLFLLPAGTVPPNPLELLERPAFGLLMHDLLHKFDHIVVDTAAAVHGADGFVAATRCGGALLVARRHGRLGMLQEMAGSLAGSTAQMAGVLVNEH